MTNEFPGNSKRPQQPEPEREKIESVVINPVSNRKKPLLKRIVHIFIGGDSKSVLNYLVQDVLIPQAKEMVAEATSQGVERMIYGDASPRARRSFGTRPAGGGTQYNRYAVRGNNPLGRAGAPDRPSVVEPRSQDVDDLLFATRAEAELTLERMYDMLANYESVSVADLNSLVGRSSTYTEQKWGWTSLQGTRIFPERGNGYVLELPRTVPLS